MDTIEEDKPLLPVPDGSTEKPVIVRPMYQFITLEIIGILHFGALMAMFPIQQFYVIDEIAKKYGEDGEKSNVDYCPKGPVFSNSTSNIVQAESANILMYLGFVGTFIAVIPILVFGSLTDRYGRKFPLYLSMVGILLKEIVMTVTVYKGLSLWFLALGEFFLGITGHFGLFLAAMMGMIADITTPGKDRAIKITILEGTLAIAVAFSILDYTIIIVGTVSAIASSVTLAFSSEDGIVYLYAVIGIMAVSISPLLRSVLSRLVSPDEQGSLFACIGSSELLLTSLAQLFYGFIYKESVSYLPGLVFLITAGILVIEFCLSLVLYSIMSSEPVSVTETVIKVS
ncbi:unnamed protein product [Mytilus edulis]|uniref:Uncharacterized protein n=1 Tax=Mytilus edulis TaxID=6550 RepID=A0A8S3TG44_MYTED|nr:unnamed protein product [Mytilus edulis]